MDKRFILSKGQLSYGTECDVYSLGVVILEIISLNSLPIEGKTQEIVKMA